MMPFSIPSTVLCLIIISMTCVVAKCDQPVDAFVNNHCAACHNSETSEADLVLPPFRPEEVRSTAEIWEQVVRKLRSRQMPPLDQDTRPAEEDYIAVLEILESELDASALKFPQPGRTQTLRRLTRAEYGNVVRDLLQLNVDVTTLLPKDEVSHGFDNITVGELTPTLLNRYLSAARIISQLAVGNVAAGSSQTFRMRPDITQEDRLPGLPPGTRGGMLIPYHFPASGNYTLTARLMRDRNEHVEGLHQTHQLEVSIDRRRVALFTLKRPKSDGDHATADDHLKITVPVTAGPHDVAVTFLRKPVSLIETRRQPYQARYNYHRSPRQAPALYEVTIAADADQNSVTSTVTPSRQQVFGSVDANPDDPQAAAQQILSRLIRLAYRRPVTKADLAQPLKFFEEAQQAAGFEAGIQEALAAVLVNPNFLFRIERQPANAASGTVYRISDMELATRLSFFLWSSLPDDELLTIAENNRLSDPTVLADQVRRMLRHENAKSLATRFASQWLYLRNLETITPDGRLFPDFDHNLRLSFRRETELLFESMVREDRSVLDLLDSDFTYLDDRLAKHYGIPHVYGSRFRRVNLGPDSKRGGLLRHASILTVTSYATRTSPVIRGNWILENLVGSPPPPPPDDVPDLKDNTVDSSLSVRQRLAAHRANPNCASCHNLMDPIGFALENYDAIGRWRNKEEGQPIDSSGGLPGSAAFQGVAGLEQALLERPELFVGTLAEKLMTYALGRGVEHYDGPAIRHVVDSASQSHYRFSEIILGIVTSPPFQMRTVE